MATRKRTTPRHPSESTLTLCRLKELLHYDPGTGLFTWRVHVARSSRYVGDIAGCGHGKYYVFICVDKVTYTAHRLAWFYTHGSWPSAEIDHKDMVVWNNRISNLREATHSQNNQNKCRAQSNNKSGFRGVSRMRTGKWKAQIKINRQDKYLGLFDTAEQAHCAYLAAKATYHPYFVETNSNAD